MHLFALTQIFAALLGIPHRALALFEPRAVDLSTPDTPAAILPEHRNHGLFDRPAPIPVDIDNTGEQNVVKLKRAETVVSADPVSLASAAVPTSNAPPVSAAATTSMPTMPTATDTGGYAAPTGLDHATDQDTYLLPSAYDSAQLSSLFAAESSFISEAGTLLSAFPATESGIACTGVSDVSGGVVTLCGPTGDPRATGGVKSEGGRKGVGSLKEMGLARWVCLALGVVGGGVAFFL